MNFKRKYIEALRRDPVIARAPEPLGRMEPGFVFAPYIPAIPAPAWLVERMERLRAQPPPTVEEVRAQWAAGIEQMRRRDRESLGNAYR